MAFNLQDAVFQRLKKDRTPVVIYLITGFHVKGVIRGFDAFTLLVELQDGNLEMIYKHAISCVNTAKGINITELFATLKKKNVSEIPTVNTDPTEISEESSVTEDDIMEE